MELNIEEYYKYFSGTDTFSALPYVLETVNEFTSEFFGMKACENGSWWYGEWEGHKRKVVSTTRIMSWGWNYDFIPHVVSVNGEVRYTRTERSFSLDIGECYIDHLPEFNRLSCKINYDVNTFPASRYNYEFPDFTNNASIAREHIRGVFKRNLPFMQEFFEKVKTDEDCIKRLDRHIEERSGAAKSNAEFVKAFILANNGHLDEAEVLLTHSNYSTYRDEKMLARLRKAAENRD